MTSVVSESHSRRGTRCKSSQPRRTRGNIGASSIKVTTGLTLWFSTTNPREGISYGASAGGAPASIRTREATRIRTQRSIGWTSASDDLGKLGGEVLDERADRREHALPVGHQGGQRRVLGLPVGQYPP